MRIIAINTIRDFWLKHPECEQALKAWVREVERAEWNSPNELKAHYRNSSIITGKRIVFNIKGNEYRLLVDIEFRLKIIFIVWFGSHKDYDQINAKNIRYDKADQDK